MNQDRYGPVHSHSRYDSRMPRHSLLLISIVIATCLTGCATPKPFEPRGSAQAPDKPAPAAPEPGVQTQSAIVPEPAAPAEPLPPPVRKSYGAATKALVTQSQSQLNAGNTALAAATIERALRIEPDNPSLWIELANIRHQEGNDAQAENVARKALAMATGDGKTQAAAWRVIAESYRARGRNPEAREAMARAVALGG
jgi:tetratricopeptide (TPR) repeat protein